MGCLLGNGRSNPAEDPFKNICAELFDYFQSTTYLEDPQPIIDTLGRFEPAASTHLCRKSPSQQPEYILARRPAGAVRD